ncbi:MAG: lysozyme [Lachnospiraceae bacterium]|nr:lysozyme [Lachnospiraceae bacterium]
MAMTISDNGISLIKRFEGCRLIAYKPVAAERYYTIGYGHYGKDVYAGMHITQAQADAYLRHDVAKFVADVNCLGRDWDQNQFDALVSFAYNCGKGNLVTLTTGRNAAQIADHILLYNKGAGGVVMPGLVRRRKEERALFVTPVHNESPLKAASDYKIGHLYHTLATLNVRIGPGLSYRKLRHSELAANEIGFDRQKIGCLDKGTPIIPQDAKTVRGTDVWIKITSGWICGKQGNEYYVK